MEVTNVGPRAVTNTLPGEGNMVLVLSNFHH